MIIRVTLMLSLVLLSFSGKAQKFVEPVFSQLDVATLGTSVAYYQIWDSEGKLWVLTNKGLLYFNGYKSKFLDTKSSGNNAPLSNEIRSIQRTGEDEFWLTYKNENSISKFNPITFQFNHFFTDTVNFNTLPDFPPVKLYKENDSTFWLLTWGAGICRLNSESGLVKRYTKLGEEPDSLGIPSNFVKEMIPLDEDEYLLGFFQERYATPYIFNSKTEEFRIFPLETSLNKLDERMGFLMEIGLTIINFIHRDENENIWFGTYVGLIYFDKKNQTLERISEPGADIRRVNLANARNYIIDDLGYMWISTSNQGIMAVNRTNKEVTFIRHTVGSATSLADDRILSLNTDPFNNIWVSTEAGIFSIYTPRVQKFQIHRWSTMALEYTNASSQPIPVNQMVVMPNGNILISNKTGLVEYDPTYQKVINLTEPTSLKGVPKKTETRVLHFRKVGEKIHFILKSEDGNGADKGIWFNYETKQNKILETDITPHGLMFKHSDSLAPTVYYSDWGRHTLMSFDSERNRLDTIKSFPDSVKLGSSFSLILNSGKWFISGAKGNIILFDPFTLDYQNYSHKYKENYFPDSTLNCAYKDSKGIIWIGTETGLYTFDESTKKFEKKNGELQFENEEKINALVQDNEGIFWIALAKDLVRWNQETKEIFRFDRSHGLECGSFIPAVAQKDATGKIYIACYNGILIFNPLELKIPKNSLQLFLSDVFLFDSTYNKSEFLSGKSTFDYDENFLTFEFYTNQITSLTPHYFSYKLIGSHDESWQSNGVSNRIRLADLDYGNYTLEVKATNTFHHESNVLKLSFKIEKPFWLTWWFFALILIVLALLVFYYIKHREKALRKRSIELEKTVGERTHDLVEEKKEVEKQRQAAEHQKELVEEKQKEITDSINYAKRIQDAYLPNEKLIADIFDEAFILFKPKDIVSGDFYWFYQRGLYEKKLTGEIFIAAADCTGHGVPGAIMSVICWNALNEIVVNQSETNPAKVLDRAREIIIRNLKSSSDSKQKDGMDIAFCKLDKNTNIIEYAGAHNPLWIYRRKQKEMEEIKADKQPVGMFDYIVPFKNNSIQLEKGDLFYIFSDGFADQFGGPKGKKFKSSSMRQFILENVDLPVDAQKKKLSDAFELWKGDLEQVDDVCIIGVRV